MANNPAVPVIGSTSSPAASPTTPFDPTALIAQLDQLIALVPGFEPPDPKLWRNIARKSGFPNEYIEAAANIVDASAEMLGATHFDSAAARHGVNLSNGLQTLINEAENFTEGLRFTDAKLRASLVSASDQVYALAPGVARADKSLTPHIDAMRHASRRKGGRKKAATPAPAKAPTTPPATTAKPVTAPATAVEFKAGKDQQG